MKRRQLLLALAALPLAEHIGMLREAWAAGSKLAAPGFYRIRGDVRLNGEPAREGMTIKPGDRITTGRNSEAVYVIGEDAFLQRDNSLVEMSADLLKRGLRVFRGKLMSVFGKGDKRIETPTATIGIRGTGCYIEAEPERVYFCLCYGEAQVGSTMAPDKPETIRTRYHDSPYYLHASGEKMMVPAAVINHTDAELILLESLVGRLPPFYQAAGYGSGRY